MRLALAALTSLLGACSGLPDRVDEGLDTDDPTPRPSQREPLPAVDAAVRASMALLGRRPTPAELDRVREDPAALADLVTTWLEDPSLGATVRDLYAELLSMRSVDLVYPQVGAMTKVSQQAVRRALSEEPLALIEHVVLSDLPLSTILTADISFLDRTASKIWKGHDYDPEGSDVQQVHWTDGRPAAGILTTNALWARHASAGSNYHRGRANLIAKALLCEDFLGRDVPVTGDLDLSDDDAVAEALNENPACVSCHQAMDPLASHLWVFHPEFHPGAVGAAFLTGCTTPFLELCYPFNPYRPAYDLGRQLLQLRPPGYYGGASEDLGTLGQRIAEDPRFASCTVRRYWSYLAQVPLNEVPFEPVARLQQDFEAGGLRAKDLLAAIVLHPDFLAWQADTPELQDRQPGPLVARPWQQASVVKQLTGFDWVAAVDNLVCTVGGVLCYGDTALATDDTHGFQAMAGGVDGARVLRPTHTPTPVKLLFTAALAEEAAAHVVASDWKLPAGQRLLLRSVEPETADEGAVRAQLVQLHRLILAEALEPNDPEITATLALWTAAHGSNPTTVPAWRAVIAAMLQDPRLLFY